MKPKQKKVLVAMSGGVDSSVAAWLLKKADYKVIGAFMKNWSNTKDDYGNCAWRGERRFAQKIAIMLKIPLITLDFEKEYKRDVVKEMFKKYKKGITPNPDIDCNKKIKFPLLWREAKKLGVDFIATGHFARIRKKKGKFELLRAKDESKDQSYFLYTLKEQDLKHILFPCGDYTKKEIRALAKKLKFPNYNKKSTVGICFIGKVNLKEFLQKEIKPKKGKILSPNGKKIGEHDGIYYYTIGQRIGSRYGIEVSKKSDDKRQLSRWYVARKDVKRNVIVAAPGGHPLLFRQKIIVKDFHLISEDKKEIISRAKRKGLIVFSRIRQVGELIPSTLFYENKKWIIILNKAITGVSPGQAIVLYQGKKVLGGGEIRF